MPRKIEIVVPSAQSAAVLDSLRQASGLLGLRHQGGASIEPPGDLITIEVTNHGKPALLSLLEQHGVGKVAGTALSSSDLASIVSPPHAGAIVRDTSEGSWEEMEQAMNKESAMDLNALLVMAIAGLLATIGIVTNAVHIVIAAMLIAPGFQPIVRGALGLVAKSASWKHGVLDVLRGYAVLVLAAMVTTWFLANGFNMPVLVGEDSYLPAGSLVSYWVTIKFTTLMVSVAAAAAGAILIADDRSILTSGVMVGLALVPSATIVGMAVALQEWTLLWLGMRRWLLDVSLVALLALLVFVWKRWRVHGRDMML